MGQSVEVVTSELHLAAERLSGAGQRLQDGLSAVDLESGNLLGSGWQGEAAAARWTGPCRAAAVASQVGPVSPAPGRHRTFPSR